VERGRRKHSFAHGAHVHADCARQHGSVSAALGHAAPRPWPRCRRAAGGMEAAVLLGGLCCCWCHYPSAPPLMSSSVNDVAHT
jgi:hypothetical protein